MKTRFSFGALIALLTVFLVVGLLPASQTSSIAVMASGAPTTYPTGTMSPAPTQTLPPFVPFPTRPQLSESPTSIPLPPTYTSIPGETPETIATPTLLPIDTQAQFIPTQTLVFFATKTATPNRGTATPPVPVAYALGETPQPCYKGPSLAYVQLDTFKIARIAGKDASGEWWYLSVFKGDGVFVSCWVSGDLVTTGGNLASLSVNEPELPQIILVRVDIPGQPAKDGQYVETIMCDAGLTKTTLHFVGQIFTNGPIENVGYLWATDAPGGHFQPAHTPVKAWNTPAQSDVDLSVPAQAGSYTLSLRTTFPMEILGEVRITVMCK